MQSASENDSDFIIFRRRLHRISEVVCTACPGGSTPAIAQRPRPIKSAVRTLICLVSLDCSPHKGLTFPSGGRSTLVSGNCFSLEEKPYV